MKRILIPTDFSDTARNALKFAISLFGEDCKFILLNAFEEPSTATSSMISLRDVLEESAIDSLKDEEQYIRVELNHPNIDLETHAVYGDAVSAISHYLRAHEVDFIVMGTTGATGLKEVMIGSVASSVIQKVKCPVFAIPGSFSYRPLKQVLFASDLRNVKNGELPRFFVELLQKEKSEVTILTISKDGKPVDQEKAEQGFVLHNQLKDIAHHFETIQSEDIDEGIEDYAHAEGMDLVVTTPRKGSWFDRLLKPSVSKRLAHHLDIPMLALNQA